MVLDEHFTIHVQNVNYEDPVTLYAFLNQTCGTQIIPDNKSGLKLIQNFPGLIFKISLINTGLCYLMMEQD